MPEINDGFKSFNMSTCREKAHFLAQCYHESDGFMQAVECGGARKEYSPWFGRGFIQITWQGIYAKYEEYAEEDFTSSDTAREKLEKLPHCIKSAFWFYNIYVSKYAKHDDFNMVVALINGGVNCYLDRLSKPNDIVFILSAQHLSSKIKDGVFPFSSSEIYVYRVCSYSWGRYHDPELINVKDTGKNSGEALNAYQRALALYKAKNDKKTVIAIEKRITSLRDKVKQ